METIVITLALVASCVLNFVLLILHYRIKTHLANIERELVVVTEKLLTEEDWSKAVGQTFTRKNKQISDLQHQLEEQDPYPKLKEA